MNMFTKSIFAFFLFFNMISIQAAEIKVMASVAFKEPYLEMLPEFERTTGHKVITTWLPTVEIMERMKANEAVDLLAISSANIDQLIQAGKVVSGSRVDYVKSGIGVGIRKGTPRPDLSSGESFKKALLSSRAIAYSTGPSGVYIAKLFEKMGITDAIKDKLKVVQGVPAGEVVLRGDADIGLQQIPEILSVQGIEYVGPLPADIQSITTFSFGIPVNGNNTQAVKEWIQFLKLPSGVSSIKRHGLDPI